MAVMIGTPPAQPNTATWSHTCASTDVLYVYTIATLDRRLIQGFGPTYQAAYADAERQLQTALSPAGQDGRPSGKG